MAQSYVPAGTDIICTEMMSGKPAKLGISHSNTFVLCDNGKKPLLNTDDKKLSCSLQCRIKQSFFAGLGGLLTGLAVGALAVFLVVATAGAAAAVIVAAAATAAVLAAAAGTAVGASLVYKYVANECDCSLEGKWSMYHGQVSIQGYPALLQRSILTCAKGGVLSLIMDPVKAEGLATKISKTNQEILDKNAYSKLWQGFIGNASNALLGGFKGQAVGSVAGLVIGSGLSVYSYWTGSDEYYNDDNMKQQQVYAQEILRDNPADLVTDNSLWKDGDTFDMATSTGGGTIVSGYEATMNVITHNKAITQEAIDFSTRAFEYTLAGNEAAAGHALWARDLAWESGKGVKDIGKEMLDGMWTGSTDVFGKNLSNKWFTVGGIAIGLVSAMINNRIESEYNKDENILYREMIISLSKMREDMMNNINIIAWQ